MKKLLTFAAALAAACIMILPLFLWLRQRRETARIAESRRRDHVIATEKVYRGHDESVVIDDDDYADDPDE